MPSRRRQSPLFCKRAIDYENLRIGVLSWPNSTFQLSAGFGLHRFIEIDGITKAVQDKNPLLLVHSAFYFPAVYSILYDPNEVLTCIQITTRRKHHILLSSLRLIQSFLERDAACGSPPFERKAVALHVYRAARPGVFRFATVER